MKKEIIIFLIGLLLGAVISTASILVYSTVSDNSSNSNNQTMQMPNDNGQGMNNQQGSTPPDMPNGDKTTVQNG